MRICTQVIEKTMEEVRNLRPTCTLSITSLCRILYKLFSTTMFSTVFKADHRLSGAGYQNAVVAVNFMREFDSISHQSSRSKLENMRYRIKLLEETIRGKKGSDSMDKESDILEIQRAMKQRDLLRIHNWTIKNRIVSQILTTRFCSLLRRCRSKNSSGHDTKSEQSKYKFKN